jgi:hypothetical protein
LTRWRLSKNVARLADRGAVQPEDGLRELTAARALAHRFGPAGVVGGYVVITLGAVPDPAANPDRPAGFGDLRCIGGIDEAPRAQ